MTESKEIFIETPQGEAYGVIHYNDERITNWCELNKIDRDIIIFKPPVTILKNMNIEEKYQGRGFGTHLLELFMEKACDETGLSPIILIADIYCEQPTGIDLVKWYEFFGFETIGYSGGYPVMAWRYF